MPSSLAAGRCSGSSTSLSSRLCAAVVISPNPAMIEDRSSRAERTAGGGTGAVAAILSSAVPSAARSGARTGTTRRYAQCSSACNAASSEAVSPLDADADGPPGARAAPTEAGAECCCSSMGQSDAIRSSVAPTKPAVTAAAAADSTASPSENSGNASTPRVQACSLRSGSGSNDAHATGSSVNRATYSSAAGERSRSV